MRSTEVSNERQSDADTLRELLAGFEGTIPRRGPGLGYRLTLLLTAFAITLLIVYFAMVATGIYGMYWYAVNIVPMSLGVRGKVLILVIVFHVSVLFAGAATIFSMIGATLLRRSNDSSRDILTLKEAPLLHSFVAKVADTLGAPRPAEIRMTLDVNASASYEGGLWGLFRQRLVLTIGAPLIAGMNTQQLAGIIAHELGHFSQRGGMALQHFVFLFICWCVNAMAVQQSVADAATEGEHGETSGEKIFRFVLWATQSIGAMIVKGLANIGIFLTFFVSRRQEFDADRYEAELAGSEAFFGSTRRLIELSLGYQETMKRGFMYYVTSRMRPNGVGNLTAEIVAFADAAMDKSRMQVEFALQTPTGWLDTHPGTRERIAAVKSRPRPGIFHLTIPAWRLYPKLNPSPHHRGQSVAPPMPPRH